MARPLQNIPDIFSLLAELAIALAGFTGVTSAFAGRERLFSPMERTRLQAILLASSGVLAGCLVLYSASSVGLSEAQSASLAATAGILVTTPVLVFLVPGAWRHMNDPDSTTEAWVLVVVVGYGVTLVGLFGAVAFQMAEQNLLVVGYSLQLMFGLWMFVRLLTRPN